MGVASLLTPQSLSQPPVIHLPQQSQFLPEHPEGTKYSNRACGSHSYSDQHRGVLKTLAGISSGIGTKGLTFPTVCIRFNRRAQPQDFMGCSTEKRVLDVSIWQLLIGTTCLTPVLVYPVLQRFLSRAFGGYGGLLGVTCLLS